MIGIYAIIFILVLGTNAGQCNDMEDAMICILENIGDLNGHWEQQQLMNDKLLKALNDIDSKLKTTITEVQELKLPSDCGEALKGTQRSGTHSIKVETFGATPIEVYCEGNIENGNWTVIQRRQDGSVDFFRNWNEYKQGFGDINGEFFIGLDKLHALTSRSPQELLIVLEDFENQTRYAKYSYFSISAENEDYKLTSLGAYSGDAGDSLRHHKYMKFSTKDRDNDESPGECAMEFKGGWWYNHCHHSNLNGLYLRGEHEEYGQGIEWNAWKGVKYSMKRAQMLIRPATTWG